MLIPFNKEGIMEGRYFVLDPADGEKIGYIEGGGYWEPKRRDDWTECMRMGDVVGNSLFYQPSQLKGLIDWEFLTLTRVDNKDSYPLRKD